MLSQSRFLAGIAASLSAVGSVLMVIALVLDELFAGVINLNEDVKCGWENVRVSESDGFESIDHLAGSEMRVAGLLWLSFAIGSTVWGLTGILLAGSISCCTAIPSFRYSTIVCLLLAGISSFVAGATAFGFWTSHGAEEQVCDDYLDVGASVILAFIAGSLFLFALCIMSVSASFASADREDECRPRCYASYDHHEDQYCRRPVQMQCAPKCVPVVRRCVPMQSSCAPKRVPCDDCCDPTEMDNLSCKC